MNLRRARKLALALPVVATVAPRGLQLKLLEFLELAAPAATCGRRPARPRRWLVASAAASGSLKTGLKVFVIPKNLGNTYFTTADSANSGGAIAALTTLGETGTETSGTAATPSCADPGHPGGDLQGRQHADRVRHRPDRAVPDAQVGHEAAASPSSPTTPTRRPAGTMFINQASTAQIGTSEVDVLAKELGDSGQIAIVSAAASATNQNAWIGYMKTELKKYPKMSLVSHRLR